VRDPAETDPHRRAEPAPPAHELLALQRRMGNQAVLGLLRAEGVIARKEVPATRTPIAPVTDVDRLSTPAQWKAALEEQGVRAPYAEIATLLSAKVIDDVAGTRPDDIHVAGAATGTALRPGLNFFHKLPTAGQCGYLYGGDFTAKLPATRDGPVPAIAIVLGSSAFVASNKARTLAVLRHELEHAAHDQMARKWLLQWRADTGTKKPFRAWLAKQSIAGADLALVRERIDNTKVNTEALSHLEGFMAGFAVESEQAAGTSRRAYEELVAAGEHWDHVDAAVKTELKARLVAFKARLPAAKLAAFQAKLRDLKRDAPDLAAVADDLLKR
jgi:hypothetical protein